ncbi:MAG: LamG domain-containing protein [Sphingobacteriaceae bacterium]|nr:MAG: LamG domain-containing protein [Sphingobacteriaceae bacterium]
MKIDNKYLSFFTALILLTCCFYACKKSTDQTVYNADKAKISTVVDSANNFYTNSVEGKRAGNYSVGSRTDLKTAIDLANAVKGSTQYSQQEVNNATANLRRAIIAFQSRLIQDVSADNLIAQWKFTGNANDASGHNHNGTLMTGYISGGSAPVDGNTLPTNSDNYMFSLNTYNGFKLQLQGANFLFMTFRGDLGYRDVDSNPGVIPADTWTYASVSYTNGTMKFYVNDKLVKTAAVTGVPVTLATPVNLVIGQSLPKSLGGNSYFRGALDDIRFYNRVLTDAEQVSIYTTEQP